MEYKSIINCPVCGNLMRKITICNVCGWECKDEIDSSLLQQADEELFYLILERTEKQNKCIQRFALTLMYAVCILSLWWIVHAQVGWKNLGYKTSVKAENAFLYIFEHKNYDSIKIQ